MNLTIPNVTSDQLASISSQIAGTAAPPPSGNTDDLRAVKAAPSNWAAYTFCNGAEWGALDAAYGTAAVNDVKNYYQGPYRMNGYPNPGDPNTGLRAVGAQPPIRYYYKDGSTTVEDTGQADEAQKKLAGHGGPTLPIRS